MALKALGYLIITTSKPADWDRFLTELVGTMRVNDGPDGVALYRVDDRPFRFWIEAGEQERLTAAAYEVSDASDLAALGQRIIEAGGLIEEGTGDEVAARGVTAFFRTRDPAGNGLEFYHGDSKTPVPFVSPLGIQEFITGDMGLGHAVFSAPNFDECVTFYRDVVGFHETDMPRFFFGGGGHDDPGMGFAFMHADNGRHHSVAVAEGPVPPSGCIHVMLELPDLVEVGKAYDRMKAMGYPESASLGQHQNDETVGFYVQTPGGFDLEIGCDSLVIDPTSWEVTRHEEISKWGHEWAWQKAMKEAAAKEAQT